MIRVLLAVTVLSFLFISVHCNGDEQMRQTLDVVRAVCQPKHKISDDVVLAAREGKFPEDKNFKCYAQCVMEFLGTMKKAKVLYESAIRQFDVLLPDDYKEPYKYALEKCKTSTGGTKNPCDAAYNVLVCFHAHNSKISFLSTKMLKFLLLVVTLSLSCISVHCSGETQMRQSADMVRAVCQPKHKVTDDVVLGAREGKFPDEKSFKCYAQCVMEMMGIMKKNKVTYESAMRQFDVLLPEDYKEPFKTALGKCKDATGGAKNPCEASFNFLKCFYQANPKFTFA
ncbi:uncharacterized protein LOC116347991 [Contarinia nasturtii]|uniref:uncharacterized protein LOC116347991 n=1 Tax=Contarinia nasturtii TaxID=265458 RepID=UPI0012D4402E|nr:uncharacterized protein LOC116347991 [Contarinia nasturtii]